MHERTVVMSTESYPVPRKSLSLTILAWPHWILVSTVPDIAMDKLQVGFRPGSRMPNGPAAGSWA